MSSTKKRPVREDVTAFMARINSPDPDTHYAAWRSAGPVGAPAVLPLADSMSSDDKGIQKAAKGAMETIAHYSARMGSAHEARDVTVELVKVGEDGKRPTLIRAWAIHLSGYTGDGRAVPALAKLLGDREVREEARMALEQIPGSASFNALKKADAGAGPDFKPNLDQSLHDRILTVKNVGVLPARP